MSHAEQRFSNVLDALCVAGGVPRPQPVLLARTEAINAFAAGWDEHSAIIAVTQGALDQLTRNELQGMVAHELSHLREGDTRMNMQLAGMVYGLELVYNFGDSLRERGGLGTWFGSAIMVAGFAGWLAGRVLQAAVSRLAAHSLQLEPLPVLQLNARPPKLVTDIMPCVPCSPALLEYQHEDATHQRPSPLLAHPLCR